MFYKIGARSTKNPDSENPQNPERTPAGYSDRPETEVVANEPEAASAERSPATLIVTTNLVLIL